MGSTSSVSSSVPAFAGNQANNASQAKNNVSQAKVATTSTFANLLHQTQVAVGLRSSTGFKAGATYEAQTITGQTKAAFNSAVNATKAVLHIK